MKAVLKPLQGTHLSFWVSPTEVREVPFTFKTLIPGYTIVYALDKVSDCLYIDPYVISPYPVRVSARKIWDWEL